MNILRKSRFLKTSLALSGAGVTGFIFHQMQIQAKFSSMKQLVDQDKLARYSRFETNNTSSNRFKLKNRDDHIKDITENNEYDILIIGGGATGAGCALSAANAGVRTLLVDAYDYASATSSKSSKLIHGGKPYYWH